jgi:hypothetical protein
MNDHEFYEIFKDYDIQSLRIPGFDFNKKVGEIPKTILINSFFNQKKKDLNVIQYVYNRYRSKYSYNYNDSNSPDEIIQEITLENYNELLAWLLVNPNEDYVNKAAEYIISGKLDQLTSKDDNKNNIDFNDNFKNKILEIEEINNEFKNQLDNLEIKNKDLEAKNKNLQVKNKDLQDEIKICKNLYREIKFKLEQAEANINMVNENSIKKDKELGEYKEKYKKILQSYEEVNNELNIEKLHKTDEIKNKKTEPKSIVIANINCENITISDKVEIHSQDDIQEIISKWDKIGSIYVMGCYINETNKRKLVKQAKKHEKEIKLLDEDKIKKIIVGGTYNGYN